MDKLDQIMIDKTFGLEEISEDEFDKIAKFLNQHVNAIQKKWDYLEYQD